MCRGCLHCKPPCGWHRGGTTQKCDIKPIGHGGEGSFRPQTGALTLSTPEGATCILFDINGRPAFFNSHLDAIKGQLLSSGCPEDFPAAPMGPLAS